MITRDPVHVKSVAIAAFASFLPLWLNSIPEFAAWAHQPSVATYHGAAIVAWTFFFNAWILRVRETKYGRANT